MKLAAQVAADLERYIISRRWPVGEVLFSEAELIDRYQVSRTIVREAARLLEQRTIARMRRGPGGGLVVCEPEAAAVSDVAAVYLEYRNVTSAQLAEARVALEVAAVGLAIEGLTDERAARLRESVDGEQLDAAGDGVHPHDLHLAVAEASGNPAFQLFVEVVTKLVDSRADWTPLAQKGEEIHRAHQRIVEAILDRDVALAQRRMRRHLEAVTPWIADEPLA